MGEESGRNLVLGGTYVDEIYLGKTQKVPDGGVCNLETGEPSGFGQIANEKRSTCFFGKN